MTPKNRLIASLAVLCTAALALAGCSSDGGGDDASGDGTTTLKVATIGLVSDGALQTGIKQGFFEDEGLEIETSVVANPPAGLAAAQSGEVDVAYSPSIPLLNGLSQGLPLKVVGAADGFAPGSTDSGDPASIDDTGLFAAPGSGVSSVADLRGKRIAVPARKAQMEVVIADELKEAGIGQDEVEWVVLDFASAVSALQNGTVDAAGLVSPFTSQAAEAGDPQISAPSVAFFGDGAVGMWTAGESTIEEKGDAIDAFQRAIKKSNEYANEHPEEAIQAGLDYTQSSLTVDQVKTPYWPSEVQQADLERPDQKLVDLGFLPQAVDVDGAIYTGSGQ